MTTTTKAQNSRILRALRANLARNTDRWTGEVNLTALVEEAACDLGHSEWLDDPDHTIWEMATRFA